MRQIHNLTILEIESLLETSAYTRERMDQEIRRLETRVKDLKRHNKILKENLLAEQCGLSNEIRSLKEQVASLSMRLPIDIRV